MNNVDIAKRTMYNVLGPKKTDGTLGRNFSKYILWTTRKHITSPERQGRNSKGIEGEVYHHIMVWPARYKNETG